MSRHLMLSLIVVAVCVAGCTGTPAPAPTPTALPATVTATPVPTQPPTATATPVPPTATNTPLPTATNTPVPPTSTPTRMPPTATNTRKPTLPPGPTKPPTASWNGIPIMPQAVSVMEEEGFYGYAVKATVDQVRGFYDREMSKLGWRLSNLGLVEGGGFILLCEKGSDSIAIMIVAKGDMTVVAIGAKK